MKAITYTEAREKLAETMDRVCEDHAPVTVTKKRDRAVVIMSLEDYESLAETSYLLKSPRNARRLLESIKELQEGKGREEIARVKIIFSSQSWEEYLFWGKTDRRILKRINELVREICRTPFAGTGKPEPLKHALAGYWSRRINSEHRIVYKVEGNCVLIAQVRHHY